jgi:hypothetical protein
METIKKTVNILVMIYLVLALLIYLDILNIGQNTNPGFYTNFFLAGGFLMLLELITENIYIMMLKKSHAKQYQHQINELKANLYDQKKETQDLIKKHEAELATARATPSYVPPQVRHPHPQESTSRPVLTPIDPDIVITPAPLPPTPVNPADYPTHNTDSDTYREPNR